MSRGRKPRATEDLPTPTAAPELVITIDKRKFAIGDLLIFSKLGGLKDADPAATNAAMLEVLPVLDRLVEGGVYHYPVSQLPAIMQSVSRQLNEASDPNS